MQYKESTIVLRSLKPLYVHRPTYTIYKALPTKDKTAKKQYKTIKSNGRWIMKVTEQGILVYKNAHSNWKLEFEDATFLVDDKHEYYGYFEIKED